MIKIYTDGSSRGNPGPGGYAAILTLGVNRKEISQGYRKTTNNRMELMAVIAGLEVLKKGEQEVVVYSDSKYVVDAVEKKWVFSWQKKGLKGKKNQDLWERFLRIYSKHKVKFVWLRGHAGNIENERCDKLAVSAAENYSLMIDEEYENSTDL